jgi:hypothetical protein
MEGSSRSTLRIGVEFKTAAVGFPSGFDPAAASVTLIVDTNRAQCEQKAVGTFVQFHSIFLKIGECTPACVCLPFIEMRIASKPGRSVAIHNIPPVACCQGDTFFSSSLYPVMQNSPQLSNPRFLTAQ